MRRLPERFAPAAQRIAAAFAEGIAWPREAWRGIGILLASVAIKLLAATHLFWSGPPIGVLLEPAQYLFMVVCLGFLIILGHFIHMLAASSSAAFLCSACSVSRPSLRWSSCWSSR